MAICLANQEGEVVLHWHTYVCSTRAQGGAHPLYDRKYVLDFHPGDVFWWIAAPGWVVGISYGSMAPLVHGVTNHLVDEADVDAETRFYGGNAIVGSGIPLAIGLALADMEAEPWWSGKSSLGIGSRSATSSRKWRRLWGASEVKSSMRGLSICSAT